MNKPSRFDPTSDRGNNSETITIGGGCVVGFCIALFCIMLYCRAFVCTAVRAITKAVSGR